MKSSLNTIDWIYSKNSPLASTTASKRISCKPFQLFPCLNCCCYPCLQFIFGVAQSFIGHCQPCPTHNNQGNCNLELLSGQLLGIHLQKFSDGQDWVLLLVVWCRVLLSDTGSSSSRPLKPGQHYLLQALNVDFYVESEVMWDWVFGFHPYESLRLTPNIEIFVLELPAWMPSSTTCYFQILWGKWIVLWCYFPHRQCPTDSSLLHSRQNLRQNICAKSIN